MIAKDENVLIFKEILPTGTSIHDRQKKQGEKRRIGRTQSKGRTM